MTKPKKQTNIFLTFLKILGIILGIIAFIVISLYCYLKFALGIDLIDIKRKLDLINKDVSESYIITNPYSSEDISGSLIGIFGDDTIYNSQEGSQSLNLQEFYSKDLLEQAKITDKQFCALTNAFLNEFLKESDEDIINQNAQIKQIKFSNLINEGNKTKVDIQVIAKFDLSLIKNPLKKENNAITKLLIKYIPDSLYFTDNFTMEVNLSDFSYSTKVNSFIINQLSQQDSSEIIKLYDRMFGQEKGFVEEMHQMAIEYLFGTDSKKGLINSINGIDGFDFEDIENTIYMILKKA